MNTRQIAVEYRLSHWAEIMRNRTESGLSVREFCKREGYHENIYFYWQRKLRETVCDQLQVADSHTSKVPTGFTEVKMSKSLIKPSSSGAAMQGMLCFDIEGVKFTADSSYPPGHIALLLRGLTQIC